jgi:hypothetical protein
MHPLMSWLVAASVLVSEFDVPSKFDNTLGSITLNCWADIVGASDKSTGVVVVVTTVRCTCVFGEELEVGELAFGNGS